MNISKHRKSKNPLNYIKKSNKWSKNKEDLSHFLNINSPIMAYLYGLLWADGTVSYKTNNIKLKISNEDFQDIKEFIMPLASSWNFRIYTSNNLRHKDQAILDINHKGLRDFLVMNDFVIKSGASPDKILSKIPEHLKHYWWRGFFDGDGSFVISGKTCRISLCSCHDQDWRFVKTLCKKLKIGFRISIKKFGTQRNSTVNFENETYLRRFAEYIYQGDIFGLKRKLNKYKEYIKHKINARPNKTSKYIGVMFNRNRWVMQIYKQKPYRVWCDTEIEAARHYDRMAKKLKGNKAILNFPND